MQLLLSSSRGQEGACRWAAPRPAQQRTAGTTAALTAGTDGGGEERGTGTSLAASGPIDADAYTVSARALVHSVALMFVDGRWQEI